ncbi:hypothetical protein BsWGS_23385 [Bradybaena similaris]
MSSTAAAQIMRQADAVKNTMSESGKAFSELWVTRQKLEDLYKKMLLLDLEYALDKKVEQELWNHAFKNQINTLQTQAKDRQNPKKAEAQASLNLFLETASGFYLQFLQMICSTFKLDLPFRRRSGAFGIMRENTINYKNIMTPKKSSCLYICCHCLVHLGDIARYRQQMEQAQTYYRHAANLSPNNGQPYNQLAILEASRGDKLSTVFYYIRSLAVRHPFPVAATNLEKFYSKLIKDTRSDFDGSNLTMSEIITAFLQFEALLHMSTGLDRAAGLKAKIITGLGSHIRSQTVSSAHLTGIVAISVFALHRAQNDTNEAGDAVRKVTFSAEEKWCVQIHIAFSAKLLETMLLHTPKEDNKARDFLTLPAIKVLFDWLYLNKDVLQKKEFMNTSIWSDLCKLLNTLQWLLNDSNKAMDITNFEDYPLPEDTDLRCFQPLEPTYSSYNFSKALSEDLTLARERDLRCQRLVAHGKWLAQDLSRLKLVVYQPTKSIRNQFSTQKGNVEAAQITDNNQILQKPPQRQNVAMQTIMKKQMQKKMEQEKGSTSPLSVISEEGKSPTLDLSQQSAPTESAISPPAPVTGPKSAAASRQAGVLNIHHKGGNLKNLPPRLSAKVAGNQNTTLSPRLQKKQAARGNAALTPRGVKSDSAGDSKDEGKEVIPYNEPEAYPALSMDDYPALVSQRSNTLLIPQNVTSQQGNAGFLSNPNWGVLNLGRDNGGGAGITNFMSPVIGVQRASSPVDNVSGSSRSPQASPRMVSPFSAPDQTVRSVEQSNLNIEVEQGIQGCGLSFPNTNLTADFLSAIRSASQFIQQQNFHPMQQQQQQQHIMMNDKTQQSFQQNAQYNQSHINRMLTQQQQLQSVQQAMRTPRSYFPPSAFGPHMNQITDGGNMSASSGNISSQAGNTPLHGQNPLVPGPNSLLSQVMKGQPQSPLGSLNIPPPPQRGMTQQTLDSRNLNSAAPSGVGYQASRANSGSQSYLAKPPAPVGFIPPSGIVPPQGQPTGMMGNSGFPSSILTNAVGAGRNGTSAPQPSNMNSSAFLGVQQQQQHPQQQHPQQQQQHPQQQQQQGQQQHGIPPHAPKQSTGLLYQNIPLPGSAASGGSGGGAAGAGGLPPSSAGLSGLFIPGQGQPQGQSLAQMLGPQQSYNRGGPGANLAASGQDSRISSSFQGHAAGTPKPEKGANAASQYLQQQQQANKQAAQAQQSMIRAVMDPPFLQASGEYTLFSNNSSPAWPTSLVKSTPSQLKAAPSKGSGPAAQLSGNQLLSSNTVHTDISVNMQGMWSNTGPSPLERLLEQQRSQRQADG